MSSTDPLAAAVERRRAELRRRRAHDRVQRLWAQAREERRRRADADLLQGIGRERWADFIKDSAFAEMYRERARGAGIEGAQVCRRCMVAGYLVEAPPPHRCPLVRPTVGYHVTPRRARESIEVHGLDWRRGQPWMREAFSPRSRGNYFWDDLGYAISCQRGESAVFPLAFAQTQAVKEIAAHLPESLAWLRPGERLAAAIDVWRVDVEGLTVIPDVATPRGWFTPDPIPAPRCELVQG